MQLWSCEDWFSSFITMLCPEIQLKSPQQYFRISTSANNMRFRRKMNPLDFRIVLN